MRKDGNSDSASIHLCEACKAMSSPKHFTEDVSQKKLRNEADTESADIVLSASCGNCNRAYKSKGSKWSFLLQATKTACNAYKLQHNLY